MKKSKLAESQMIKALKENESGRSVEEISLELGINKGTFYSWRKKYRGMEVSHQKRLIVLESLYLLHHKANILSATSV